MNSYGRPLQQCTLILNSDYPLLGHILYYNFWVYNFGVYFIFTEPAPHKYCGFWFLAILNKFLSLSITKYPKRAARLSKYLSRERTLLYYIYYPSVLSGLSVLKYETWHVAFHKKMGGGVIIFDIGATIRTRREIQCVRCEGFFLLFLLLSAHIKRFTVFSIRDFSLCN